MQVLISIKFGDEPVSRYILRSSQNVKKNQKIFDFYFLFLKCFLHFKHLSGFLSTAREINALFASDHAGKYTKETKSCNKETAFE